ncbi:ABC transporter ATP-binding protein (plasmid) [Cetobacterium somerae]|uniref:ABC transporter ATP-binding protein n=1 Tax=Cetobacterium somerae TaxID=188913 RepID=UPI003D767A7B
MLIINELKKHYVNDLGEKKIIFNDLKFEAKEGEFISIIGGNGAGKTTFFNSIIGNTNISGGSITLAGKDITNLDKHLRNKVISKVYQDPSKGTSPSMTIYENLSMADNKGKSFNLSWGLNIKRKEKYKKFLSHLDLGLENHLNTKVGNLSGGQRQCLSLIMSVLGKPKLLLLDEHTAALDPKISKIIMDKTEEIVKENGITTLMITHELQDAIDYGDRLIMLNNGKIVLDVSGEEKKKLTKKELMSYFF